MEKDDFAFKREFNGLKKLLEDFRNKYQKSPKKLIKVI